MTKRELRELIGRVRSNKYLMRSETDYIINALEEIQQYRKIEREIKEHYQANVDIKMIMKYFMETIFKGEKHEHFCILTNEDADKWDEYKKIGTPEECRAAVDKQTAKLVIDNTPTEDSVWYQCPTCKGDLTTIRGFYCQYCGKKLHWR